MKITVTSFDAEKLRQIDIVNDLAQKKAKNTTLTGVCKKNVAQLAQLAQKTSVNQSLLFAPGASGAENRGSAGCATSATSLYRIPPNLPCAKRDKSVSGTLYIESGASGARLKEAYGFLRQKTAILPGWAKRRCRRQAIMIFNQFWNAGEEQFFDRLREAVKDWKKVPWDALPADLPRTLLESSDEWLDRCYEAAGFATMKDVRRLLP